MKRTYQPNRRKRVKTHGISPPDEDHRRTRDHQAPPGQGPQAPRRFRLDGAPGLPTLDWEGAGMDESFPPERRIRKGSEFAAVSQKRTQAQVSAFHAAYPADSFAGSRASRHHRVAPGGRRRSEGIAPSGFSARRFGAHGSQLPSGVDLVAVARNSIARARLEDVERAFRNAFGGKANS